MTRRARYQYKDWICARDACDDLDVIDEECEDGEEELGKGEGVEEVYGDF